MTTRDDGITLCSHGREPALCMACAEDGRAVFVRQMKPCPFCGHQPDATDPLDVIYPIGRTRDLWGAHCTEAHGGCSASMLGTSEADAVERWNRRAAQ